MAKSKRSRKSNNAPNKNNDTEFGRDFSESKEQERTQREQNNNNSERE